jgi:hypothetical protein
MCEKIVNIYCTFCRTGYRHGNALYMSLDDEGKLAQELGECLDRMPPELAGLGVSTVGLGLQCNWARLRNLVPSQPVPGGHLSITSYMQYSTEHPVYFITLIITAVLQVLLSSVLLGLRESE